jgi:prepilin-type N-terminal cleavage/methylation domain-containing protein
MPNKSVNTSQLTVNRKSKGFTLIELLVVITIIGILATFIVASFTSAQRKGRDARRKSDLDAVKKALELVKNDCTGAASYPEPSAGTPQFQYDYLRTVYLFDQTYIKAMTKVPTDPNQTGASGYHYVTSGTLLTNVCPDTLGTKTQSGRPQFYLSALLENTNDPAADTAATGGTSRTKCNLSIVTYPLAAGRYFVCEP